MRHGHCDGPREEQLATAQRIHRPDGPYHAEELQRIQHTGHDELDIEVEPHRFKQGRRVIDQSVHTNELLEERDHNCDMCAAPAVLPETVCPRSELEEECVLCPCALEGRVFLGADLSVEADFGLDVHVFLADASVGGGQSAEAAEAVQGFLVAIFGGEPARGEGEEDHARGEEEAGDHLEEEGETPGPFAGHVPRAEGSPVCDDDAECDA